MFQQCTPAQPLRSVERNLLVIRTVRINMVKQLLASMLLKPWNQLLLLLQPSFVGLCTYNIQNVSNNAQTQRNPIIFKIMLHFDSHDRMLLHHQTPSFVFTVLTESPPLSKTCICHFPVFFYLLICKALWINELCHINKLALIWQVKISAMKRVNWQLFRSRLR